METQQQTEFKKGDVHIWLMKSICLVGEVVGDGVLPLWESRALPEARDFAERIVARSGGSIYESHLSGEAHTGASRPLDDAAAHLAHHETRHDDDSQPLLGG